MIIRRLIFLLLLTPGVLLLGCQGIMKRGSLEPSGSPSIALAHGYGLLYSTIDEESKVDQILILKNPEPAVAELLKAIGEFSRIARKRLEEFAGQDPAIVLDDHGLPEVEVRTRASISAALVCTSFTSPVPTVPSPAIPRRKGWVMSALRSGMVCAPVSRLRQGLQRAQARRAAIMSP